jgi:hypothetical protein
MFVDYTKILAKNIVSQTPLYSAVSDQISDDVGVIACPFSLSKFSLRAKLFSCGPSAPALLRHLFLVQWFGSPPNRQIQSLQFPSELWSISLQQESSELL